MAGDWIKMNRSLPRDPRVVRISSALKADRLRTVGGLLSAWCLADELTEDGRLPYYTPDLLDELVGLPGLSAAMAEVGWMVIGEDFLEFPRFSEHNGNSAKRRAQDAVRKMSAREADKTRTNCGLEKRREEKRREDNKEVLAISLGNSELWPSHDDSADAASGGASQPARKPAMPPRMAQDRSEQPERTQTSAAWFDALKSRVNGLKTEWQKPARWSYAEDRLLADGVASQMDELDEDDWAMLKKYLMSNTGTDATFWKPRTRSKFVETFSDVMESARRWASKNGTLRTVSSMPDEIRNNPAYK